jgi:hypothetical protein
MTSPEVWVLLNVIVGGVATLAIFSFLIKENGFYRFFEHLYIGIAAGFGIILPLKVFLWPKILEPMLGMDIVQFPDGTFSREYNPLILLYLAPALFGLLFYTIYSPRYSWMAKLVIGLLLGMSGGMAFEGFFNYIIPQLDGSLKPLIVYEGGAFQGVKSLNNSLFVFTLLAVMYYFFFSFRPSEGQKLSKFLPAISASGRWLMMVCFGAYFGSTVMARMALLVERLQFLLTDWKSALMAAASLVAGV